MVELPHDIEDLGWIVSQGPSQLLLIPGVRTASLTAAAAGDAQALAYLRFAAQNHAGPGAVSSTRLDDMCCAASRVSNEEEQTEFDSLFENEQLYSVFNARSIFTVKLLELAAEQGRVAALKWLRALCHRTFEDDADLMEAAAGHGHLHVLKFLQARSRPPTCNWDTARAAVRHPDCFLWLMTHALQDHRPCPPRLLRDLAHAGNVPGLQFLHDRADQYIPLHEWDSTVTAAAAQIGSLPTLQWLRAQDPPCPWNGDACSAAANGGHLEVLRWLRSQDPPCSWSSTCSAEAARAGRLEVLQWLRSQRPRCPWSPACSRAAAAQPTLHMMQWLQAQDPPCPVDSGCMLRAAGNGLPMLQWLLSQDLGVPLHRDCPLEASKRGDVPMLQMLNDQGCTPTGREYYAAARCNHIPVLRWLDRMNVPVYVTLNSYLKLNISNPMVLFLGDIGAVLPAKEQAQLIIARRTFCTFYGLLRWCSRAVSDPSKNMHRAFDTLSTSASGENLLVRLSMLPPELLSRIALAAGLQHTLFQDADDDHLYPQ